MAKSVSQFSEPIKFASKYCNSTKKYVTLLHAHEKSCSCVILTTYFVNKLVT